VPTFAAQIDALTIRTSARGHTIDSRTPPFLIDGSGRVMMIGLSIPAVVGRAQPPGRRLTAFCVNQSRNARK
jgi:hypothetical protein